VAPNRRLPPGSVFGGRRSEVGGWPAAARPICRPLACSRPNAWPPGRSRAILRPSDRSITEGAGARVRLHQNDPRGNHRSRYLEEFHDSRRRPHSSGLRPSDPSDLPVDTSVSERRRCEWTWGCASDRGEKRWPWVVSYRLLQNPGTILGPSAPVRWGSVANLPPRGPLSSKENQDRPQVFLDIQRLSDIIA